MKSLPVLTEHSGIHVPHRTTGKYMHVSPTWACLQARDSCDVIGHSRDDVRSTYGRRTYQKRDFFYQYYDYSVIYRVRCWALWENYRTDLDRQVFRFQEVSCFNQELMRKSTECREEFEKVPKNCWGSNARISQEKTIERTLVKPRGCAIERSLRAD